MAKVDPKRRESFAQHASPEAIAVYVKDATAALRKAERDLEWLLELQARRAQQVAAGEWPPPADELPPSAA